MGKGLPRSRARGPKSRAPIVRQRIAINTDVTVSSTGAAIGFGSQPIGGLPEGNVQIIGAVANLAFAGSGSDANLVDTWNGDVGVGSTPAADATITGTDVDVIASTAIGPAVSEVIAQTRCVGAASLIDNTDGSGELNLNLLIDAADIVDDQSVVIAVTGLMWLSYVVLGDD